MARLKRKGISLIVLIITIIVVIILAAVVILTISKNNPIKSAKEAKFKEDVRNFQSDLAFTISKQYIESQGNRDFKITIWSIPTTFEEIKKYIPNYIQKYDKKFGIEDDEIVYFESEVTDDEKKWLDDLGMKPWGANIEEASEDIFIWDGSKIIGYNAEPLKDYLSKNSNILKIPEKCNGIQRSAFNRCYSLVNVIIPNSVKEIREYAFFCCYNLENVIISESMTYIASSTFDGCINLKNIKLPNSITSIKQGAFDGCLSLKEITIPNSVTNMGNYAFRSCTSLTSVTLPDSVGYVPIHAFAYCTSLTNVVIGNGVTGIGNEAFSGCTSLTNITIPNSVRKIKPIVFYECVNLNNINFNGTKSEWEAITKEADWNYRSNIQTITCTDGIITL